MPELARLLCGRGATRVVLFGSLATGDVHDCSDIDLATEGLPSFEYWAALADLGAIAPVPVDLVRIEDAAPAQLASIARGVRVDVG